MPRKKTDKFYLYRVQKSGPYRGRRLLGINQSFEGDTENLTLQDLLQFLEERQIELSTVLLPPGFRTVAKVST
jgi:hypothetical protein